MASRTLVIKTKMDNKDFHAQIKQMEHEIEDLQNTYEIIANESPYSNQAEDLRNLEADIEKATNKLKNFRMQQDKIDMQDSFNMDFSSVEKGMDKTIKRVAKWGIALFGIESIYGGIRNAMGIITQYNDGLNNKIESIKYTLAMSLEPIITKIVNWVYTLIQYVNYLAKAWFGVDLFANATANSIAQANKNTREMKKSLAGFDTANTLSDNGLASGISGNVQAIKPLEEAEAPKWLVWIKENGKNIAQVIAEITTIIILLKTGVSGLMGLGIGIAIAGIIKLILDVINYINNPSWENFKNVLGSLELALVGVSLAMIAFNATNPLGWITLAIAGVIAVTKVIVDNWNNIKAVLSSVGNWIYKNVISPVSGFFVGLWNGVYESAKNTWNRVKNLFKTGGEIFNGLKDGIVSSFKAIVNTLIDGINRIIKIPFQSINGLLNKVRSSSVLGVQPFKGLWNENPLPIPKIPKLAVGGIINNPGHGVPLGNAIGGEAGREGVLPLTNSTTMRELGREIGKHVTINVDLTTRLDSRVLSRTMQQVQNERNFAKNGV